MTLRDNGLMTLIDPGADAPLMEMKTLMCVHCGGHFPVKPGSGNVRGFCTSCSGPVCGPGCAKCVPLEQYLENLEKGRQEDFRPIFAYFGSAIDG